jgi:ABC-type multidrug transport system ATPase subunit
MLEAYGAGKKMSFSILCRKYLAYIPEPVMLYRNLTGIENLEYFTALAG